MGLDMYLKSAPKVESIEELHALEIRLSDAYFADNLEKELKKVQKEKGFKNPIEYTLDDYLCSKEKYEEIKAAGEHWPKVSLRKEVGYWRKFNALHNWFVETFQNGVDECQSSIIDVDVLREFLYKLQTINKENAAEILPTTSGFFFGGTEYDEWYWESVEELKSFLLTFLVDTNLDEKTLIYRASW